MVRPSHVEVSSYPRWRTYSTHIRQPLRLGGDMARWIRSLILFLSGSALTSCLDHSAITSYIFKWLFLVWVWTIHYRKTYNWPCLQFEVSYQQFYRYSLSQSGGLWAIHVFMILIACHLTVSLLSTGDCRASLPSKVGHGAALSQPDLQMYSGHSVGDR